MKFKQWIKLVVERIGRVITEMISVKVLVMSIVTYIYMQVRAEVGLAGFIMVTVGWFLVIGLRFAAKWTALVKQIKD